MRIINLFKAAVVILSVGLCLKPGWGADTFTLTISDVDLKNLPNVDISFKALDLSGKFIKDIAKGNLLLSIDEFPIAEFSLSPVGEVKNLSVTVAIDASGSMKGKPLEDALTAVSTFVERLDRDDQIALCAFSNVTKFYKDFVNRPELIKEDLETLVAEGNTILYDAIYDCIRFSNIVTSDRRAVIVLSDGKDTESKLELDDCLEYAQSSKTPIYSVALGDKPTLKKARRILGRLSKLTGGKDFYAPSSHDLFGLYETIRDQLKNDYVLTLDVPKNFIDGNEHKIILEAHYHGITTQASTSLIFGESSFVGRNTLYIALGAILIIFLFAGGFVFLAYFFIRRR